MVGVSGFEPEAVLALLEAICPHSLSASRKPLGDGNQEASGSIQTGDNRTGTGKIPVPVLWSECRDSNPRPLGPEPSAIPNFATPRWFEHYNEIHTNCQEGIAKK